MGVWGGYLAETPTARLRNLLDYLVQKIESKHFKLREEGTRRVQR
jgi:hypothetical protein